MSFVLWTLTDNGDLGNGFLLLLVKNLTFILSGISLDSILDDQFAVAKNVFANVVFLSVFYPLAIFEPVDNGLAAA